MCASAAAAAVAPPKVNREFAQAVAEGLTRPGQKTLSPSWFYDNVGSALFETITLLPEYGLTRAEAALLARASREIVQASGGPGLFVELGSGTGTKTLHLLEAASRRMAVRYMPIDISGTALNACAQSLDGIAGVTIKPVEATYFDGLELALAERADRSVILLFLGSTIGNFNRTEAAAFLRGVSKRMRPGDHLLLGADLVKPEATLLSAYDDPIGVTAAFNLNLLARINRELDGQFDLSRFVHEARWNERRSRIEMHLRSRVAQRVWIGGAGLTVGFSAGETIWTESSHKFRAAEIVAIGRRAGWRCVRQWVDSEWGFAETLFRKSR